MPDNDNHLKSPKGAVFVSPSNDSHLWFSRLMDMLMDFEAISLKGCQFHYTRNKVLKCPQRHRLVS